MMVVVLGASPKPERFSNRAIRDLTTHGHKVFPVNPAYAEIAGLTAFPDLRAIGEAVDTLTVYLDPRHSLPLLSQILQLRPRRVILNPGTESPELTLALRAEGIEVVEGCTLVMLSTGQF